MKTAQAHGQSPDLPLVRSNTPFPGSLKSIESPPNPVTRPMGEGSRLTLISALVCLVSRRNEEKRPARNMLASYARLDGTGRNSSDDDSGRNSGEPKVVRKTNVIIFCQLVQQQKKRIK